MSYRYLKLGPFITHVYKEGRFIHTSRSMRKEVTSFIGDKKSLLTLMIAILFMIGSACFVAGSYMSLSDGYSSLEINMTYFIGSIFFTSAAYGQYLEAINADITEKLHLDNKHKEWKWFAFRQKNLGYLSSITQLVGTVFFNFNTYDSFNTSLSALGEDVMVWIPNMAGSLLFLVSSFFAWLEIYKDDSVRAFVSVTWWIVWANIIGSVFFQISAIASFVYFDDKALNELLALNYTLLGAVCFFIGAFLLIVEMRGSQNHVTIRQ